MQYATQCLSVVNNVLNILNLLLYMDRKLEYFDRIFVVSIMCQQTDLYMF